MLKFACLYFPDAADVGLVAKKAEIFSSQIYLLRKYAVLIEIGKSHALFSESEFLEKVRIMLTNLNLRAEISIAENQLFSFVMAKYACAHFLQSPLEALNDIVDPQGRSPEAQKKTAHLIRIFKKLQLKTLQHFHDLPMSHFPSRFGDIGRFLKLRIRGEMLPSFERPREQDRFFTERELQSSYKGTLGSLISIVEDQIHNDLLPMLRNRSLKIEALEIVFVFETNSRHPDKRRKFTVNFVAPQSTSDGVMGIARTCLETELRKTPIHFSTPILFIETEVIRWTKDLDDQVDMLDKARAKKEKENILVNKHQQRYGETNVFRAELTEKRIPELSWCKILDPNAAMRRVADPERIPIRPVYRTPPQWVHIAKDHSTILWRDKIRRIESWDPFSETLASHWFLNEQGQPLNHYNRIYRRLLIENGRELSVYQDSEGQYFLDGFSG